MQHQAFRLSCAGELLQGADAVHTNIVRFIAVKFTDSGFQPVYQGISLPSYRMSAPMMECKKIPRKKCSFMAEVKGKR
ncbi:MAG: hypothetical protein HFF17_09085 [Oscillospiraceae bacterium]|nr:hypothetical protein [Oscillospiraceae bacterium]